ncbi:MAG: hypothetical protein ACOC80_13155, partial [Petrotogales bacterium]
MIIFLTLFGVVEAQILSPVAHLEGTINPDTKAFFVGHTSFSGNFNGYDGSSLIQSYLQNYPIETVDFFFNYFFDFSMDNFTIFPLLGTNFFQNVNKVTIIDVENLDFQSVEDALNFDIDTFPNFSHVNIIAEQGFFILGTDKGSINTNSDPDYAISSALSIDMEGETIPFLLSLTESKMNIQYMGEQALLAQSTGNASIIIQDSAGNILWNNNSMNKIFFIEDKRFSYNQDSPIYLFPLEETTGDIELSISPAESRSLDIYSLLNEVTDVTADFGDIPDFSENLQVFDEIISTVADIVNGGMILVETNDTFTIDNSEQTFTNFGFARGNKFKATLSPSGSTINGEYKLIFLGDHLYTSQAKESENGVALPVLIVLVWAIAIGLFLAFRFYIKKDVNEELDEKIKRYALIFHIIALIVAFILMDREISYQFGFSAIDALTGQGISLV